MTVDFRDYFWGKSNNGFLVLYKNLMFGRIANKDLVDFLRERSNIEKYNCKLVRKLARKVGGNCSQGSFGPVWTLLRVTVEKIASLHFQMVQKVGELVKEVSKYADNLYKKHRTVKEVEGGTLEVVLAIQNITDALRKSRDSCKQKEVELDRLREGRAPPRDIEKVEEKLRKAQEEYKVLCDEYEPVKKEFEKRMTKACKHFQEVEEGYLKQMIDFLRAYAELEKNNHDLMGQVHIEFKKQCLEMTVDTLLEEFVTNKYTGIEKPDIVDMESMTELSSETSGYKTLYQPKVLPQSILLKTTRRKGFHRSRRHKRKEKKIKEAVSNNKGAKSDVEALKSNKPTLVVFQKCDSDRLYVGSWDTDQRSSFFSSSDCDSDGERPKKIHVEIKPLSPTQKSARDDVLKASVENLYLPPLGAATERRGTDTNNRLKRSQQIGGGNTNDDNYKHADLRDTFFEPRTSVQVTAPIPNNTPTAIKLVQSSSSFRASFTPTGNHPYTAQQTPQTPTSSTQKRVEDCEDKFFERNSEVQVLAIQASTSRRYSNIVIPRPSSRSSNRGVPVTLPCGDNHELGTSTITFGTSGGPSSLTNNIPDSFPLAVAFHEIIHSHFKGDDKEQCQVKLYGDMTVSFPIGIVLILIKKPSPAQLSFKLHNSGNLDNILPNKELINMDTFQEETVFEFNMCALISYLRRESEQHASAMYFNVKVLKYQVRSKPGVQSCPLQLVANWKCNTTHTDLNVHYKYNYHAMASPAPLLNVTIVVPMDRKVTNLQSKPSAIWMEDENRAVWKFTELSQHCAPGGDGTLKARFELAEGPSNPVTLAAHFNCEGTTLSGIDFSLIGHGYKILLIKRRFISGKYQCDGGVSLRNKLSLSHS